MDPLLDPVGLHLRAVRNPLGGAAALLSELATVVDASMTAVYILPARGEPAELIAAGGSGANVLGAPDLVGPETTEMVTWWSRQEFPEQAPVTLSRPPPWCDFPNVSGLGTMLGNESSCVLLAAGTGPISDDSLARALAGIALVVQQIVHLRELKDARRSLYDTVEERSLLTAALEHDLRTPLTAILGSARTLQLRSERLSPRERARFLEVIVGQTERLQRMVVDDLAKAGTGPDSPLRLRRTGLRSLAERVAQATETSGLCKVVVQGPDMSLLTDADRLERALMNLIDNAAAYSPEDAPVYVIIEPGDTHVGVTVADAGPGVSSDVLPGLFEAFATDPTRPSGTGLGLHSVRRLVEQLGGRVHYERRVNSTRFTITLPQPDEPASTEHSFSGADFRPSTRPERHR